MGSVVHEREKMGVPILIERLLIAKLEDQDVTNVDGGRSVGRSLKQSLIERKKIIARSLACSIQSGFYRLSNQPLFSF